MRRLPAFFLVIKIRDNWIARERFERQRRDEMLRVSGHHNAHIAFGFREQRRQIRRFVRGNRAGHAENNLFNSSHILNLNLNPQSAIANPQSKIPALPPAPSASFPPPRSPASAANPPAWTCW